MKKIIIITLIFQMMAVHLFGQNCNTCGGNDTLYLTTGLTPGGTLLPMPTTATSGVPDPFWRLINIAPPSMDGSGGVLIPNTYTIQSGVIMGIAPWLNITGARALGVIPNHNFPINNDITTQPWRFIRKFYLCQNSSIRFNVDHIGDDIDTVKIYNSNGTLLFQNTGLGHSTLNNFDVTLDMNAGCCYMVVELANIGASYTGYSVRAELTTTINNNVLSNPNDVCCGGSIISGQKIIDQNCNNIYDKGELPGVGWVFNLLNGTSIIQTTTTDANGEFTFYNVPNGTYTVAEINQPGYTPSLPNTGQSTVTISQNNSVVNLQFLNCPSPPCNCEQILKPILITPTNDPNNPNWRNLDCGQTYTDALECFKQNFIYIDNPCGNNCSPDSVVTTIKYPSGVTTIAYYLLSSGFIANQVGTYTVSIKVKCNGVWCKECKLIFKQTKKCEPPCDNCKVNGQDKVQAVFNQSGSSATVLTHPAATTLNAAFLLSGGADTYTQVRVNVVDFNISSDNPACMECYNTPNNWGSIISGTLSGFSPLVTSYPSVSAANGNNNPREIVFNASSSTAIPMATSLNISIKIPGISPVSCCCLRVAVFVKVTYRNNKCEECSKIVRIDLTECPPTGSGTTPVVTFNTITGQPQYRMHSPNTDDAKILNQPEKRNK